MAGVDFFIELDREERALVKGLLSLLQHRAKRWGLELNYKYDDEVYQVGIHGSLPALQAFVSFMINSEMLQVFSLAFPKPDESSRRQKVAKRISDKITEMTSEITGMVFRVDENLGGFPNSYFFHMQNIPVNHAVVYPLTSFTGVLVLYHNGFVNTTPLIEAGHTAIEALLKQLVGNDVPQGTKERFKKMVNRVTENKYIELDDKNNLNSFNSMRTTAKHDGREVPSHELEPLLSPILESCHKLLAEVIRREGFS